MLGIGYQQHLAAQAACSYVISGPGSGTSIDIGGTSVALSDDALSGALPIGFNFNFFGTTYSAFYISSNGYISFDAGAGAGCCSGQLIPSTGVPNAIVAGYWEDLNPGAGGSIGYGLFGVAPARRLVVSYTGVPHFGGSDALTFQIKLHESSNVVEVINVSCTTDGGNHTTGIEDISGTLGFSASGRNAASFSANNETTTFTPVDATNPTATCPSNISLACPGVATFSASGSDNCQFARITQIAGPASGSSFPAGTTTITFRARDHGTAGVFNNGAGGTFFFSEGDNAQTIAFKACESVYGAGNCVVGACGSFTYYYRSGHPTCNCNKVAGQYEFVYANTGYTDVGQDYGGTNAPVNFVPFVRVKGPNGCSVPNTWLVTNDRLGGNASDCSFTVTASAQPATPSAVTASPTSICAGGSANLNATSSGSTISWFTVASGGTAIGTSASGANFAVSPVTTTTYYAEASNGGCINSTRVAVTVTVSSVSTAPSSISGTTTICSGASTTLTQVGGALGAGAVYNWYSGSCGGTLVGTGASVTVSPTSTTTYFVRAQGTCNTTACASVVVTVNTNSTAPTSISGTTAICSGGSTTLTQVGGALGSGASYNWYSGSCGGTLVGTGTSVSVSPTTTTTYFVRAEGTCNTTACASVTVTVNTVSTAPTSITGTTTVCPGVATTLTQVGGSLGTGGVYTWYSGSCGGTLVGTGTSISVTPGATTTYFVRVVGTCNTTACASVTVTVADGVIPVISCPANISVNATSGACAATVTYTPPVGTDNCPGVSTSQTAGLGSGASYPVGTTTNTFTATNNGQLASCSFTVTVVDNQAPVITCPSNITTNAANGTCAATVTYSAPTGTDNCSGATTAQIAGLASGVSYPVGTTVNTFRVTDAVGNTTSCSFTVNVVDNQLPVITCPANVSVNAGVGTCGAAVTYSTPSGTDNCGGSTTALIAGLATGSTFPVGTTTNTYRVTDASGNTATCSFTVTVSDNQPPTITCPANITTTALSGSCAATVSYSAPTGTDNCPGSSTSQTAGLGSGASFPVGVTTNTFVVTAANSATANCSFTVTVTDNQVPTITCPANIVVSATVGQCAATITYSTPVGADNCPGASTSQIAGLPSGSSFPVGTTTNTYRVTDASGNLANCTFTVKVNDTQVPSIICPANVSTNALNGLCSAPVTYSTPVGTDNCPGANTTLLSGLASGSSFPVGTTNNSFKVTDAAGNSASCNFTVTVVDNQIPVLNCPANISVNAVNGSCAANVTYSTPTGLDNCPGASTVQIAGLPSGVSYAVGVTTNTFRVTDASSNTATCSFTVTVNDNQAPVISCPSNISVNASSGLCAAVITYSTPIGTDNCPGASTLQTTGLASGVSYPVGVTTNTFRVTAANGATTTCAFTVTVVDNQAPTISCPSNVTLNNTPGICGAAVTYTTPSTSDNCSGASLTQTAGLASGATFPIGTTTNAFTVTDASGNTATCSFAVTVNSPEINVLGNSVSIVDGDLTPSLTDHTDFGTPFPGVPVVRTFTIQNSGTAALTVSTIALSGTGAANYSLGGITLPATIAAGSSTTFTVTFQATPVGVYNATVTINNNDCNENPYDFAIKAEVSCQPATVTACPSNISDVATLGICGKAISYTATFGGAPSPVLTYSFTGATTASGSGTGSGSVFSVGVTNVTITAANPCDTVTCSFTVSITDTQAPVANCQNVTVSLNGAGTGSTTAAAVNNGSSDNCAIASLSLTQTSFVCSEVGANTEVLTVTDVNGNSSTCTTTITVQDNVAPNALCQNLTVQLNTSGVASITASQVNNGSTDACGIASVSATPTSFTCGSVGANTVVLTVTDVNGNSSTCSGTVTVQDLIAPTALCQNVTVQLNSTGNGSTTAAAVNNGSSDNCAIASLSLSQTAFVCSEVGANTEVLTVTDVNGNSTTCSTTITVQDNVAPVATCQNVTVQLDNTGNGSTTAAAVNNGSSDACGIASLSLTQTSFVCSEVGANTEVLTVTDVNGNSSTCTTTITVQDNVAPNALCQNLTVQLNTSGVASITASQVNNGSNDACGIASISATPTSFTCGSVGANTVVLTVTDVNGNSSTCSGTVTIQDLIAPTALCQNVTVQLNSTGNGSTTAAAVNNGSSDNCAIASLSLSQTAFVCSEVGANTEVLTVTDVNGNSTTCSTTITVQDNVAPVATCQNVTVQLDNTGNGSTTAAAVNNGSSDACGIASLSLTQTSFVCSEVGANTEVLTVTDVNGNSSTCTTTITVQDNVAPNALCQNLTVQLNTSGVASITASQVNNGSNDACGIASVSATPTSFTCGSVGANTVVLTVTDVNGNSSTCSGTVTIEDLIAPTALCQNVTVQLNSTGNGSTTAAAVNNGSSDNCAIASLSLSQTDFVCSEVGANTEVLTVTDVNGNSSTCTTTITVEDNVAPVAICQNVTVQLDNTGNGSTTAAAVNNGSGDNCAIASLSLSQSAFVCSEVGANTEVLTVTDVNGNSSTCTTTITVEDNVAPNALCQNLTVQLNTSGVASITASQVNNGSSDACGIASISATPTSFTCASVGANTVVLTVTDVNGNSSTCSGTVTIEDSIAPTALCQNVTVQLDNTGIGSTTVAAVNNGSSDNCAIAGLSLSQTAFVCSEVGANTEVLTVTDVNGNTSTCTTTITVEDNVAPVATCQNVTVQLDNTGNGSTTAAAVDNGSSDACGIASLSLSQSAFVCSEVGANTEVLTVTDVNGNSSTCTTTVTVEDNVAPNALCQNLTVQLDGAGTASITASQVDNGSNDACGIASISATPTSFTCANVGANTVVLTVTDVNGNSSTCSGTVTIEDSIAPTALCQNVTVQLDNTGNGSTTTAAVDNGSIDNCAIASLSLSQTAFVCSEVGANTEVLTVTDVNGNTSTCTTTITVEDNVAPVATCQNVTVQLDNTGNGSTTAAAVDNGSSDACGIASLSLSQSAFVCSEVGANTEVLTVTDVNGNSSTCTTTVTVEDNVPPVALCQNLTVQLDTAGTASITAGQVDNGSNDACGIASISASPTSFSCANVGANTVVLTVIDVNANSSTCSAVITLEDNIAPIALCQNVTVQLDSTGNGSTTTAAVDNGSSDNCAIANLSLSQTAFVCSEVGANTEVLTVTDVNGNTSTCTTTITVEDNVAPVATCQNVTVQLDNTGNGSTTAAAVDNGSSDACGIASLNLSQTAFVCSEVGANTEVLTVTDVNGNSSTCITTITVEDNVAPNALCQNLTVQLDGAGTASITASQVDNGSNDACGIANISASPTSFSCANVGANTVVLTVIDVNGNSSTCSGTVTIEDSIAPTALCQNVTVQLDNTGNGSTTAAAVDNGSSDNCSIASLSLSQSAFVCSEVGANTEVLTVTDVNGNSTSCSTTITVQDNIAPVAVCQNVTVQLDANGAGSTTAAAVNNGSSDACGIASLSLSQVAFVCSEVGANTEVLTVTDVNGNSSTCTTTIMVEDTIAPTITCPASFSLVADTATCSAIGSWIAPIGADNCGILSTVSSASSGSAFPTGVNTVVYTVTDLSGNTTTCAFDITVTAVQVAVQASASLQGCGYHLACATSTNGEATSAASGGCTPYTFLWSSGATTATATGLSAGLYYVTATDAQGNSAVDSIVLTAPSPLTVSIVGSPVVCQGFATGQLSVTAAGGQDCAGYTYLWSTGDTTTSISNLSPGTYTVTATDSLGCSVVGTHFIATGAIPVLNLGPDPTTCPGIAYTFTAPSGFAAYQWSNGGTNQTVVMPTPGTYVCTVTTADGCQDADTVVLGTFVVDNNLITVVGNPILCIGDTVRLEGAGAHTNYQWSTGQTTQNIVVSAFGGAITLAATDVNGCVARDTVTVNYTGVPGPMPVITPGPTAYLCNNASVLLDAGNSYFTYSWSNGATTSTITTTQAGVFAVTVTNGFGCLGSSAPVNVVAGSAPIPVIVANGNQLTTTLPYSSYQWFLNGNQLPGATGATFNPSFSGNYTVQVTDANGCTGTSVVFFYTPVGVAEEVQGLPGLSIYPNPARDVLNLRTIEPIDWPMEVEIWDLFGRKVKSYNMAHLMDVVAFDLSDLSAATYMIKITTFRRNTSQQAIIKFVKQ